MWYSFFVRGARNDSGSVVYLEIVVIEVINDAQTQ